MTVQYFKVFLILIVAAGIWACSVPLVVTVDIPDSRIPLNTGVRDASFLTNMEKEVIVELNAIRTNPKQYASF